MLFNAFTYLLLVAPQVTEPAPQDALPEPDPAITIRELRHHVAFLASDELRGRAAGTEDAVRAARYLGRALAHAGAAPAGDEGTFLQAMTLYRSRHKSPPTIQAADPDGKLQSFTGGIDFNLRGSASGSPSRALEVLHVESGGEIPSEPDASVALFLDAGPSDRRRLLQASGNPRAAGWGLLVTVGSRQPGESPALPSSRWRVDLKSEQAPAMTTPTISARGALLEGLQDWSISTLQLNYDVEREERTDYNVVGRIAGVGTQANPEMAKETIVFSAHYDHIGVMGGAAGHADDEHQAGEGEAAKDLIFNGADDDASGTAAVVELAQAFAAGPAPARTLIFFLAAGEEIGLLGTNYYLEHPAEPLANTVANLNFEMIGRPDELAGGPGKLWLTGFERSTLGQAYQEAGLKVVPDPRPSQQYFRRSDNYAFAIRGIVAQTLSSYNSHRDYHQVTDELETIDFEHMAEAMLDCHRAAQLLADGSLRPDWLPGGKP